MSAVLVTGASKGIGRAVAAELARRGHRVVATARRPETLHGLAVDRRLRLDVTDDASVRAAVAQAGPIDALVSNAGEIVLAPAEATPPNEFARLLDINTVGALRVAQALLPQMRERGGGRLLFMSSTAGRIALPMVSAYAATKWALEALAEAMAIEVAAFGVRVTLLQPSAVDSGALDAPTTFLPEPYRSAVGRPAGFGPMLDVEEVAVATADAVEMSDPPLRLPVGRRAEQALAARHAADDAWPFVLSPAS